VVNAVGSDRPGIVSGVTKLVVNAGGNVGASQAAKLGSHFGLMMLISVPKSQSASLQSALAAMEGMSTTCYTTSDPRAVEITPRIACEFISQLVIFIFLLFAASIDIN